MSERDNEQLMQEFWADAPAAMGVYEVDDKGLHVIYLNDQYYEMTGGKRQEREKYNELAMNGVHPDDRMKIYQEIQNAYKENRKAEVRVRILLGDGSTGEYGWFGILGTCRKLEDGRLRIYTVYYDVTELMNTEKKLSEQMDALKRTKEIHDFSIEGTDIFIWQLDLVKDEITFGDNPYTLKRKKEIGYPDVVKNASRYIMANVMPESISTMKRIFDDIHAGKEQTSGDIHFRAGGDEGYTICRVSYRVLTDENGKPVKAYGSEQNITDNIILRDSYAREIARFDTDTNPDILFRTHASLTANNTIQAKAGNIVIAENTPYDDQIGSLFTEDAVTSDGRSFREIFDRGNAIASYAKGERQSTLEYRWPGQAAWKWIRAETVLVQNPATSDIELFLYCIDDTEDRMKSMIIDRMSETVYDYIAVVNVSDGSYMMRTSEGILSHDVPATYTERVKYLRDVLTPEDLREQTERSLDLDHISSELSKNSVYTVTNTEVIDGVIAHKLRQFSWLDEEKSLILICVSDVTESLTAQRDMESRIENDTAILQQASMDAYDFISVIDCDDETITLRSGSWFNRDVPTPENMITLPYAGLIDYIANNYSLSDQDQEEFRKKFALSNIKAELEGTEELFFPFDFMDASDTGRIKYKQFRFSWLDETHEKILASRSDVTIAMEKEKDINMQMKDALDTAEAANAAKSEFLSRMSHDIRTPMNAIIGFSTLLMQNADDPEKVQDQSRKILSSSNHLLGLINDVLDMSKIETGKLQMNVREFSLQDTLNMISQIMRPQMEAKDQQFDLYAANMKNDRFIGDPQRIQQVLINILSNATKYTQNGGKIAMRVKALPERSGRYRTISFEIEDNGRGMSEEYQKIIFEPFSREQLSHQESAQGTGLGMPITKNLVNIMGGTISLKSKLEEGSTFTVVLPLQLPSEDEDTAFWESHDLTHMLIVDDEEEVCRGVSESMADTGVRVEYALSGEESIAMVEQAHINAEDFDIALVDWKMPGMNGIETARRMRETLPDDVLIIILTAYDYSEIEDEARAAGVDGFMAKPFFVQSLEHTLLSTGKLRDEEGMEVEAVPVEEEEELDISGLNILAAEDNALNAEILTEVMKVNRCIVTVKNDGKQAVEAFKEAPVGMYDLILMDIQMPVMNGYEAAKAIRDLKYDLSLSAEKKEEAVNIPIIAMTANAFSEDVQNALAAGMNAHVAKPLNMDSLKKAIHELR